MKKNFLEKENIRQGDDLTQQRKMVRKLSKERSPVTFFRKL